MKYCLLQYIMVKNFTKRDAGKLRGFFGNLYKEKDIFHNHYKSGNPIYRYPLIQYKVIDKKLSIVGLESGADLIKDEFLKHKKITIGSDVYADFETQLTVKDVEFDVTDELYSYRFDSIWLALNDSNYKKYLDGELNLNTALQNNLLSDLKGLNIRVDKKIMVKGNFHPKEVTLDNAHMTGFLGSFVCNVRIPEYLGTGKRKSVGFGVVVAGDG